MNMIRDWSKSTGGGGVGRSRRGVGYNISSLMGIEIPDKCFEVLSHLTRHLQVL